MNTDKASGPSAVNNLSQNQPALAAERTAVAPASTDGANLKLQGQSLAVVVHMLYVPFQTIFQPLRDLFNS